MKIEDINVMCNINKFEWFSHERGNGWKENVVLNTFLKTISEVLLDSLVNDPVWLML